MKLYFTKDHEWLGVEGDVATMGITDYAQSQLGDVVFVELPAIGKTVTPGGECAVVESVKAASDVFAPVTGEVVEINPELEANPALVNAAAEDSAWFCKLRMADAGELDGLMDKDAYQAFIATLD